MEGIALLCLHQFCWEFVEYIVCQCRGVFFCHSEAGAKTGYDCAKALPYVYHWAMMAAIAALFMNIQVTTRYALPCPSTGATSTGTYVSRHCATSSEVVILQIKHYS